MLLLAIELLCYFCLQQNKHLM